MGRLFGTNGVRGVINKDLTIQIALDLGRAAGTVLGPGDVVVSQDSRMGGTMFTLAATSGLLSTGCSVIDIGPAPTPTMQLMVPRLGCSAGLMITASHNPPEFNGIKVMGNNGIEVSREVESQIESSYFKKDFRVSKWNDIGTSQRYDQAIRNYLDAIKTHVAVREISNQNLKVVIDCANSVGALTTPQLMRELGCRVISINAQLDGRFPGRDPEPTPKNLLALSKMVRAVGADLGIAHDGDADRTTFVDEKGQVLWGDQSFAIVASRVLSRRKNSVLVTPVSSGRLIEEVVKASGAKIDWTVVGSVVVSHRLAETGAELGGEENGGVFYPPHQPVRDGPMTAAQVVEIMAAEKKKLSELVSELPRYFSAKIKVPVDPGKMEAAMNVLLRLSEDLNRITIDGIKLVYDEGWILIRPSGTESLLRCYSEAETQETADELVQRGVALIREAIAKL
ncbi:MAG: phosphoglucosamine mutase [Candidatus Thorarchaeota archaeon]|nr:MAG: phosphoglucosamine mutase [Candidatus Thorarchaeota archaeon]